MNTVSPSAQDAVPVVLCCDENFLPYAATVIQSLLDNRDSKTAYDIVLLTAEDISGENQDRLMAIAEGRSAVSLRFFNLGEHAERCRQLFVSRHVTVAAYYRLLIPEIFQKYRRVIYLDCDMVVLKDLKPLYEADLENQAVGAVPDTAAAVGLSDGDYTDRARSGRHPFSYVNSGLLVLDIGKCREVESGKSLIAIAAENNFQYHDQDVINVAFNGRIKLLPQMWNAQGSVRTGSGRARPELESFLEEYRLAVMDPAILHYTIDKPGIDLNAYRADLFWQYLGKTRFFDLMAERALNYKPSPRYNPGEKIFSVKNAGNDKVITVLGLSFRIMRKRARAIREAYLKGRRQN